MILVDTSVSVYHLKRGNNALAKCRIALVDNCQLLSS
jgi:predicted nucleic acid-binding protein